MKPWPQLRQAVKNSHQRFSEIGCKVPFLFNWREDPVSNHLRIYYLSSINNSAEITLIYCDIDTKPVTDMNTDSDHTQNETKEMVFNESFGEEFMAMSGRHTENREIRPNTESDDKQLWKPLIVIKGIDSEMNSSSREENLQLERKRIMFSGITSYVYQSKSSRFVFTSGDNIYWFDDPLVQSKGATRQQSVSAPPYLPQKLSTTTFTKINPQLCPSDENLVAYVADGDLWVCNLKSGLEFRLTETKFDTDSVISAGLPSYVIQEEFRRYTGFWWRPDNEYDHIDTSGDLSYTILCEFVDETEVDVVKIANWDATVEEYRFPRPGMYYTII